MEFEIHFAAEAGRFSKELENGLYNLGFEDDNLVTGGVIFAEPDREAFASCPLTGLPLTWSSFDREHYKTQLEAFVMLMKKQRESCVGYAHAEVIRPEWDRDIALKPFSPMVTYPLAPFRISRSDEPKSWDIHISARCATLGETLERTLFGHARMYYIDIKKKKGMSGIFTVQGRGNIKRGLEAFDHLASFLSAAGGVEGSIKFEQTCYWSTYGKPGIVPPTIDLCD